MNGVKLSARVRVASFAVISVLMVGCSATKPMFSTWKQATGRDEAIKVEPWNWASVIPQATPRAELVPTTISGESLAQWAPDLVSGPIHLVSNQRAPHCNIVNVDEHSVSNFGELNQVLSDVQDTSEPIQVDYVGPDGQTAAFVVSVPEFNQVVQSISPNQTILRVSEENNPWVLLREGSVRCKVTTRVERTRSILHLAISLCNCDPTQQKLLPVELIATCDDTPLHCLNVSQSLDLLYRPDRKRDEYTEDQFSFASVSEQDEYLIPTNYRQLESELQERKMVSMPVPALATIPGQVYPGTALLGDARALTGFMLQPELFAPNEPEKTGWVLFAGESLKCGTRIRVDIDLGDGLRQLDLKIPKVD